MKICFFGWKRSFDYYQVGGTESYIRRIAEALSKMGHVVEYVMYGSQTNKIEILNSNFRLSYYKNFNDALNYLLNGQNFDIVTTIYIHPKYRVAFWKARSKLRKICRLNSIVFSLPASKLKKMFAIFDLRFYDKVFAVSPSIQKEFSKYGVKSMLLHPPISEVFFEASKNRQRTSSDTLVLGYFGRMDYQKGFDIVKKIFSQIYNREIRKIIFTYSWNQQDISDEFKNANYEVQLSNYIGYTASTEKEIALFLSKIDILILPYRSLNTTIRAPLSLVEGAVSGCNILTTDLPEIKEVCEWLKIRCIFKNTKKMLSLRGEILKEKIHNLLIERNINNPKLFLKLKPENVAKEFLEGSES